MTEGWRFAFRSVVGTSHLGTGTPCQDTSACAILRPEGGGDAALVAVVSDGAGSASLSHLGSEMACELFMTGAEAFLAGDDTLSDGRWLTDFQQAVAVRARELGAESKDFRCTIVAAIVSEREALFFQIGDGAIVVTSDHEPDDYCWVFWPDQGEYANTTYFATDDNARERFRVERTDRRIGSIAVFTDGIQYLALNYKDKIPHPPFFRAMMAPVLASGGRGLIDELAQSLGAYLASTELCARTDDDKSLVLATRMRNPGGLA